MLLAFKYPMTDYVALSVCVCVRKEYYHVLYTNHYNQTTVKWSEKILTKPLHYE